MKKKIFLFIVATLSLASLPSFSGSNAIPHIAITSPNSGTEINPGDVIHVTVVQSPASSKYFDQGVSLASTLRPGLLSPLSPSSLEFSVPVPLNSFPGEYTITAIGSHHGQNAVFSQPVNLNLFAKNLSKISASPDQIILPYIGSTEFTETTGSTTSAAADEDGIVLPPQQLSFSSSDKSVVIGSGDGTLTAVGVGVAKVTVKYLKLQAAINVTVLATDIRGDLNHDGVVDFIDVNTVKVSQGESVTVRNDARDLDSDGKITAQDIQAMRALCTHPKCASR